MSIQESHQLTPRIKDPRANLTVAQRIKNLRHFGRHFDGVTYTSIPISAGF